MDDEQRESIHEHTELQSQSRLLETIRRLHEDLRAYAEFIHGLSEMVINRQERLKQIEEALRQVSLPYRSADVVGQVLQLVRVHNAICRHTTSIREDSVKSKIKLKKIVALYRQCAQAWPSGRECPMQTDKPDCAAACAALWAELAAAARECDDL